MLEQSSLSFFLISVILFFILTLLPIVYLLDDLVIEYFRVMNHVKILVGVFCLILSLYRVKIFLIIIWYYLCLRILFFNLHLGLAMMRLTGVLIVVLQILWSDAV